LLGSEMESSELNLGNPSTRRLSQFDLGRCRRFSCIPLYI